MHITFQCVQLIFVQRCRDVWAWSLAPFIPYDPNSSMFSLFKDCYTSKYDSTISYGGGALSLQHFEIRRRNIDRSLSEMGRSQEWCYCTLRSKCCKLSVFPPYKIVLILIHLKIVTFCATVFTHVTVFKWGNMEVFGSCGMSGAGLNAHTFTSCFTKIKCVHGIKMGIY